MAKSIIGFHSSTPGNQHGIGLYFQALTAANIPAVIKSVDSYGICFELGNLARSSGVPHCIVFRLSTAGQNDGNQYDVPPYHLSTEEAADAHWNTTKAKLPPEFQKDVCWLELTNEIDKNLADWIGKFGVAIADLAMAEGYKICLPAWNSGEPEIAHWETPGMLALLQKAADNPTRLAISLHEYSFDVNNIRRLYPYLVGRFQFMFSVCDQNNIKRPTTIITEWGWELDKVPSPDVAMTHIADIAAVYAQHPSIIGAAIWNLGEYLGDIHNLTQQLIAPITHFTLNTTFPDPPEEPMDTWKEQAAKIADDTQALNYKAGASLQTVPTSQGFQVFGNEFDFVRPDGVKVRVRGAIHPVTAVRRYYWCPVPQWSNVNWFEVDGGTPTPPPF